MRWLWDRSYSAFHRNRNQEEIGQPIGRLVRNLGRVIRLPPYSPRHPILQITKNVLCAIKTHIAFLSVCHSKLWMYKVDINWPRRRTGVSAVWAQDIETLNATQNIIARWLGVMKNTIHYCMEHSKRMSLLRRLPRTPRTQI